MEGNYVADLLFSVREAAKKKFFSYFFAASLSRKKKRKVPSLVAGPLRGGGGGGVKAGPLRKKELFLKLFFLFCCHLKIKIILLKTTYRNMDTSR